MIGQRLALADHPTSSASLKVADFSGLTRTVIARLERCAAA
jgi:hypothetical protein